MNKKKKKGFTLVELLVVIAILAVLATVSILGYSAFVKKANISNDEAIVSQMNEALMANEALENKARYCDEAVDQAVEAGFILENLTPSTSGFHFAYDQQYNRFMLLSEDHTFKYGDNNHSDLSTEASNIFVVVGNNSEIEAANALKMSIYLRLDYTFADETNTINVSSGVDTGKCIEIKKVNYDNSSAIVGQSVLIHTNDGTLYVNGSLDTVTHYGFATIVDVIDVLKGTYNEAGTVGRLIYEDDDGAVKFKPTAKVYCYMNISTDETADASETTKEEGATVFTNVSSAEAAAAGLGEENRTKDDANGTHNVTLDEEGKVIVSACANHNTDFDVVTIKDKEYVLCKSCGGFSLYESGSKTTIKSNDPNKEAEIPASKEEGKNFNYVSDSHVHKYESVSNDNGTHSLVCECGAVQTKDVKCTYCEDSSKDNYNFCDCGYTRYLTFTALEDNSSVTPRFASGTWQYKINDGTWNDGSEWIERISGTTQQQIIASAIAANSNDIKIDLNKGDKVYLKGVNCVTLYGQQLESLGISRYFKMEGKISASGNVTSLSDGIGGNPENISASIMFSSTPLSYQSMFRNCTTLVKAPEIPLTHLCDGCFTSMFEGCTNLKTAPELKATILATSCYEAMFSGCTSLETAPVLPATTLAESCYNNMFAGCTSLVDAPALSVKNLATSCYEGMFKNCSALKTAPALPATTLAGSCYNQMFAGCTALVTAPTISATTLASSCCTSMFNGCTSLTKAPALTATILQPSCYQYMFNECTSLVDAPALPATTLANQCYYYMFAGCTSLTKAPALPATYLYNGQGTTGTRMCYGAMFQGCTSLVEAPELPATTLCENCYVNMFSGCSNLKITTTKPSGNLGEDYGVVISGTKTLGTDSYLRIFENVSGGTVTPSNGTTYYWYK